MAPAVVLACSLLCGGCSRGDAGEVVLRVGNWGGASDNSAYEKQEQALYREFERENPGIKLRFENTPDNYVAKMTLSTVAGVEPDIMMLDASSAATFIDNGMVIDLMPLVRSDPDFHLSDFFPNTIEVARRGERLYAIPQDFTPMVMYYNKRLFDQAGVPYPNPSWNYAEFLDTARKLTGHGRYGYVFTNWMPGWVMWLWNNGGDVVPRDSHRAEGTFDSERNVRTVEFLRSLIDEYKVSPSLSQAAATGVDPFANGEAAMNVNGHWALIGYQNAPKDERGKPKIDWRELGVVALPHDTPKSNTVMYEAGYAIGRHCRNVQAAWKFIRYMTGKKVQEVYNSSGIAVDARMDVAKERASSELEKSFLPIVSSARPPYGSRIEGWDYVETAGQAMMDSVLQNGADPAQALARAAQKIDREFSK